jgi:hypothetical protein
MNQKSGVDLHLFSHYLPPPKGLSCHLVHFRLFQKTFLFEFCLQILLNMFSFFQRFFLLQQSIE